MASIYEVNTVHSGTYPATTGRLTCTIGLAVEHTFPGFFPAVQKNDRYWVESAIRTTASAPLLSQAKVGGVSDAEKGSRLMSESAAL